MAGQPRIIPLAVWVETIEQAVIFDALVKTNWNKSRAADLLKTSRANLYTKIREYQLERTTEVDEKAGDLLTSLEKGVVR